MISPGKDEQGDAQDPGCKPGPGQCHRSRGPGREGVFKELGHAYDDPDQRRHNRCQDSELHESHAHRAQSLGDSVQPVGELWVVGQGAHAQLRSEDPSGEVDRNHGGDAEVEIALLELAVFRENPSAAG